MHLTALALIGPAGQIERRSETFRLRYGSAGELVQQAPELGRLLAGEIDHAALNVAGIDAAIEAVTCADGTRRALLTFGADPASENSQTGSALLSEPLDESPAIIWIKDLQGRYIRVNRRYTSHLGISEDRFRGRSDAELAPRESIDGPRLQDRPEGATEPLQLEYGVPEFEGRPALAVLRFPVRDRAGQPVGTCSVASALDHTQAAQAEAARLMEVERFSRLDADAVRGEFMRTWELVGVGGGQHDGQPAAPSQAPPAGPAQAPAAGPTPVPAAGPAPMPPPGLAPVPPAGFAPVPQSGFAPSPGTTPQSTPPPQQPPIQPAPAPPTPGPPQSAPSQPGPPQPSPPPPPPPLAAQRDAALMARAELGRELAHAQMKLVELDNVRAQADAAYARVEELEREVDDARAEIESLRVEQDHAPEHDHTREPDHEHEHEDEYRPEHEPRPESGSSLPAPLHRSPDVIRDDDDAFDSVVRWLPTAQRKLSASLGRMSVWRTMLRETAAIIGSEGGWDAVTAWVPDEQGGLGLAGMWVSHAGLGDFESETWDIGQARDGSLPAQALRAPHVTWVTEIDAVDDERLGKAAAHGLRSALLLPIRDGAATIALLELLAHASVKPDAQVAMSLEAAALQLGQFGHMLRVAG